MTKATVGPIAMVVKRRGLLFSGWALLDSILHCAKNIAFQTDRKQ